VRKRRKMRMSEGEIAERIIVVVGKAVSDSSQIVNDNGNDADCGEYKNVQRMPCKRHGKAPKRMT
jgi:hypothetical protein